MFDLLIGLIIGVAVSRSLSAWLNREATVAKMLLKAEVAKLTPDVAALKNLIAKL